MGLAQFKTAPMPPGRSLEKIQEDRNPGHLPEHEQGDPSFSINGEDMGVAFQDNDLMRGPAARGGLHCKRCIDQGGAAHPQTLCQHLMPLLYFTQL